MERIMKRIIHQDNCWIWTGCVNSDGYPKLSRNGNANTKGHRFVYEQIKGKIPKGDVVRHTCDNVLCLNPDHLILGTPSENTKDRVDRKRTNNFVSDEQNERIFQLRKEGLPQWKVAEIVGCSQMHVSKLERGVYKFK